MPGLEGVLGVYAKSEALKCFMVGISNVRTPEDLYDVLEDIFEYNGLTFKRPDVQQDENTEEEVIEAEVDKEIINE